MSERESCTECDAPLTESDLREGPEFPEVGFVYYKCPQCEHRMPGPPTASPDDDTPSFLPGDANWRENPREYHDQMDLPDAIAHVIDEQDEGDGAERNDVYAAAAEKFSLSDEETKDVINDLLMGGRCYEPDDGLVKTL